jgi:hypothetical protein
MPFLAANRKDRQAIRSHMDPFGHVPRLKTFFYGLIVTSRRQALLTIQPAHAIVHYIAS